METRIQSVGFTADTKLVDFTKKKVGKLPQFFDRITDADVYFKLEGGHHQVHDKVAEVKVNIPGSTLFASETCKTFEEAVDKTVDSLTRQLKKHKEKIKS